MDTKSQKARLYKNPKRVTTERERENSFYGHMRKKQSLPNRQIFSDNVTGRQLPSRSPVHSNQRGRTSNRLSYTYQNNNRRANSNNRSYSSKRSYSRNYYNTIDRNRSRTCNRRNE